MRDLLAHLPSVVGGPLPLAPPAAPLSGDPSGPLPARAREVYDVRDVIRRLVDAGALLELAPRWARNLVVGFARIDGSPVGVIANQPRHLGGCLDAAAGEKGAWFVELCDRFGPAARGPVGHARVPARHRAGARRRHPPRRRAAGRVRRAHAFRV